MAKKLTPKQKRAIESLVSTGDKKTAAEYAGVARQTIYKWLADDVFTAELEKATEKSLHDLSQQLAALGAQASEVLGDAMDEKHPIGSRLRAASIVFDNILRMRELVTLEERVSKLERQAKNDTENQNQTT